MKKIMNTFSWDMFSILFESLSECYTIGHYLLWFFCFLLALLFFPFCFVIDTVMLLCDFLWNFEIRKRG